MARPICALSLELEQSMNLQVRIMTIQDHFRYSTVIDEADDERRKKSFGFDKHTEDMLIYFLKLLDKAIESEDLNLVKKTRREIAEFKEKYTAKKKSLHDLELHYEELDDKLREWIIEYLATCLEKTQNESSRIDLQMIRENLEKKKRKNKK